MKILFVFNYFLELWYFNLLLFNFRNKYDEVLEKQKGFWSMVMERKDPEHDLELIEAKNMKVLCKNIRHGRA